MIRGFPPIWLGTALLRETKIDPHLEKDYPVPTFLYKSKGVATPDTRIVLFPQKCVKTVKVNEGNSGRIMGKDLCIWNDTVDKHSSQVDGTKSSTQRTTSISEISEVSQKGVLDNDCRG